jgi:hypothetical protein
MMHKRQVLAMVGFKQQEEQPNRAAALLAKDFNPVQTDSEWKRRKV